MEEKVLFTNGCRAIQQIVLFCTILLFLVFFGFLLMEYSNYMLLLIFIDVIITIIINLLISRIYEIRIDSEKIRIENMWKKIDYPLNQLTDIRLVHFVIPYPFNPYLKFVLKNESAYIAVIPNRMKYYLSNGGIGRYLSTLKGKIIGK